MGLSSNNQQPFMPLYPEDQAAVVVRDLGVSYRPVARRPRGSLKEFVTARKKRSEILKVTAVRGVSFEVREGESLGIVGRNGSGKSTLLRAMAGLLPVARGVVLARSQPVLLGVSAALMPQLSGRENVFLGGTALGLTRREVRKRFSDIVEFAGVQKSIDMPVQAYSSGMRARLGFAIATSIAPEVLLVDEALNVGDEEFRRKAEARMRQLCEHAGAVVIVTHNLHTLRSITSRTLWLDKGSVRLSGATADVIAAYKGSAACQDGEGR
jgi:teichoic acid transport system ATP-binding protein